MDNITTFSCAYCGADITEKVKRRRHYDQQHYFCDKEHAALYWQSSGHYKAMSVAGRDARIKAVTESNHMNPRRKRK